MPTVVKRRLVLALFAGSLGLNAVLLVFAGPPAPTLVWGFALAAVLVTALAYAFGPLGPRRFGETFDLDLPVLIGPPGEFFLPTALVLGVLFWLW